MSILSRKKSPDGGKNEAAWNDRGRRDDPSKTAEPTFRSLEASEHRHTIALILAALALYLLALLVGYAPFDLLTRHFPHMRHFVKDSIFALATACLVSVLFSQLLDLPTATRVVARNLADLLFGKEYLSRIRQDLPDLRKRIDEVHLGSWAVADKRSLYNFIHRTIDPLYISDFRRDQTMQLSIVKNGDSFIWYEVTEYTLVRNTEKNSLSALEFSTAIELGPRTRERIAGTEATNSVLRSIRLRVGNDTYSSAPNDVTTMRRNGQPDSAVTVDLKLENNVLSYAIKSVLPAELMTVEELFVRLETETVLYDHDDDVYYVRVVKPTLSFNFLLTLPWSHRIEASKFGFEQLGDMSLELGETNEPVPSTLIRMPGWLLPGHGAEVAWFSPKIRGEGTDARGG